MNCLYCYELLADDEQDYHARCSRKFFGTSVAPELPFELNQMYELANQVVRRSVSVTGVQAKLSLDIEAFKQARSRSRFTLVGLWGMYILKPPTEHYESLPEIEDLTMHLAGIFGLRTVSHSLIRLKSGELAYITKRVDRANGRRLAEEDMCQLTERLTEDKYKGSMEQVGKVIRKYSDNSGFDLAEFFETALFCFLTGNADMHLKNFSLLRSGEGVVSLAPASDLVATRLAIPEDKEELALTVNGKKSNLRASDFESLGKSLGINDRALRNSFSKFADSFRDAVTFVGRSFLNRGLREAYASLLDERARRIGIQKH
jgi:serine/threonine-protein kinase HipA